MEVRRRGVLRTVAGVLRGDPVLIADRPGQLRGEGGEEVEERDAHEVVVEDGDVGDGDELGKADALQRRHALPHLDGPSTAELTDNQLQVVDRPADEEEQQQVGNEEGAYKRNGQKSSKSSKSFQHLPPPFW